MITLLRNLIVDCSLLLFYLMNSFCCAQQNVKKRDFVTTQGKMILPSSTTIMTQMVPSYVACAALCCIQGTCCYASYDRSTKHCNLDESCCPQIEPLQGAIVLKNPIVSLSCQSGWHKYENNCYYFSDETRNWADARVTCKQYGSMLAEVKSKCENDYLKTKAAGLGKFWIGGTNIQNEGLWIWSSEETDITFFDWAAGQPSNWRSIEHCLEFNYLQSQQWNDNDCSFLRRFICKKILLP